MMTLYPTRGGSFISRITKQVLFLNASLLVGLCPNLQALNFDNIVIQASPELNNIRSVDMGDFNLDGKVDVLTPVYYVPASEDSPSWKGAAVWLRTSNNGAPTLTYGAVNVFPGSFNQASGSAIADLNGDNFPDVAIYSRNEKKVAIYLNLGNTASGSWAGLALHSQITLTLPGSPVGAGPSPIKSHDFNGDGRMDLVVGNYYAIDGNNQQDFAILLNLGISVTTGEFNGFFTPIPFTAGTGPHGTLTDMAITDFNGDGIREIAMLQWGASSTVSTTVSIYTFNEDFSVSGQTVAVNAPADLGNYTYMAVGDIDNDSRPDIAALKFRSPYQNDQDAVVILKNLQNTSDGLVQFSEPTQILLPSIVSTYAPGSIPRSIALEDMDGDGDRDLVFCYSGYPGAIGQVGIFTNSGGQFNDFQSFNTTPSTSITFGIKVGDLSGDGKPDVLMANMTSSVSALVNLGFPVPSAPLNPKSSNVIRPPLSSSRNSSVSEVP